jgi:transcriptional regulator with XRE-family HTH domain
MKKNLDKNNYTEIKIEIASFRLLEGAGLAIREKRLRMGMSQVDFAKKIGMTNEWICKIEKGTAPVIKRATWIKISEALNIKADLPELLESI